MSKCLGRDISVRQHSKSEHWAPCHIQTPSRYDWKRLKATLSPNQTNKFFYSFTFFHFPQSSLSLTFISAVSFISFPSFSGRRHKMTLKGWRVVKPQHNQKLKFYDILAHLGMKWSRWAIVISKCPSCMVLMGRQQFALKAYSSIPGPIDSKLGRKHQDGL